MRKIANQDKPFTVILGDLIGSRGERDDGFTLRAVGERLKAVNEALAAELHVPFSLSRGDEIQALVADPIAALRTIDVLDSNSWIASFRFSIGAGDLTTGLEDSTWDMDGPCFHRARDAMEVAKAEKRWIAVSGLGGDRDRIVNGLLRGLQVIREGWTHRQRTAYTFRRYSERQKELAELMGLSQPTLSKLLKAAHFHEYLEAEDALGRLLYAAWYGEAPPTDRLLFPATPDLDDLSLEDLEESTSFVPENYPHIPRQLFGYAESLRRRGRPHRLVEALADDAEPVAEALDHLFRRASDATGDGPESLLMKTDFAPRDYDGERLSAALAEIRTVNWLTDLGFTDIRLLAGAKHARADLTANRDGTGHAVEVALSAYSAKGRVGVDQIVPWISGRLDDGKMRQLRDTMSDRGLKRGILAVVVDTEATKALNDRSDWQEIVKGAWQEAHARHGERMQGLHIAVITGLIDASGPLDAVYPIF